jgi:hypothetical protein
MTHSPFFNAHHAPIGAFSSFTFGCKGKRGGLGIELAGPANEALMIGAQDRTDPDRYLAFPFFDHVRSGQSDYDVEESWAIDHVATLDKFPDKSIQRSFAASTDTWRADDLTFTVVSPVVPAPDPDSSSRDELMDAYCPAVLVELSLDNRNCAFERKVFIGYEGSDRTSGMRVLSREGIRGVGQGLNTAIATADPMSVGIAWNPLDVLEPANPANLTFMLGSTGMLVGLVPAGEIRTFRIAVCFHKAGDVTAGMRTRYHYNRWFETIEDVAHHALHRFERLISKAVDADLELSLGLSPVRAQTIAHAVRSYYGSTQLLEDANGRPIWVVNEGEYRMMNTLDLTADQLFFELRMNPWTVRNELDVLAERYSYTDRVRFVGDPTEYPGGVSFTHDEGVANVFSRAGHSAYEKAGLNGCFSYMSCEELTNWVLCAATYLAKTGDEDWGKRNLALLESCFESLLNRDHPEPSRRDGIMDLDSSRCESGSEITTYDSLDASLGQARRNLYIGVKWWAAFVLLSDLFEKYRRPCLASQSLEHASLTADTILAYVDADGLLPAILETGSMARIIPAIEPLIFPMELGLDWALDPSGRFGRFVGALETHLRAVLVPGLCKFADGAWKLSSTSNNSWLSKIYLCQHVAERLFGIEDPEADLAHWNWLMAPQNVYYAWSDQMLSGTAVGSRYYPRGVTSVLWTQPLPKAPAPSPTTEDRALIEA